MAYDGDDLSHLSEKDRDTIIYTPLYNTRTNHRDNQGQPLLLVSSRKSVGFKHQCEKVKRFMNQCFSGRGSNRNKNRNTNINIASSLSVYLSMRSSRRVLFVLFISASMYALISSETGDVTPTSSYSSSSSSSSLSNERNPYHGFTPKYETAITVIKPQSIPNDHYQDDERGDESGLVSVESSVILPDYFRNIADVADVPVKKSDIPFYFHIPRSSGLTIKKVMELCVGLRGIGEEPSDQHHQHKYISNHTSKLEIINFTNTSGTKSTRDRSRSFVNVEISTPKGIERAKKLKLIEKNNADYVVTQNVHSAAKLFNVRHRGRLFTMMRNPVERIVSLFHDLSSDDSSESNNSITSIQKMSIEMWAKSPNRTEFNWMTRSLSNNLKGELTPNDLVIAKEILRKKCLIGILEVKSESVTRLQKYFHWEMNDAISRECFERYLDWGWSNKNSHPMIDIDSPTYKLLEKKNEYDMDLYEYGKRLFHLQLNLFENENQ